MDELKRPFPYCSLAELGETLAASRRERKLSLDDISTMTCIRNNFLEDIESGDFSRFTSWVYARGFVRTYLNLMNRMELWPYYDRFLSDTPPTMEEMGIAEPPVPEEEYEQELVAEELMEPIEQQADRVISLDATPLTQPDEIKEDDQEFVAPAEEPVSVKIHIPSEPSPQPAPQEEALDEEEEEDFTPLVSEAELPTEKHIDEPRRVEKPVAKARQQQQPDPITVKLPPMPRRSGEGRSNRVPYTSETSNNADTPLLLNALTRRAPASKNTFRRRSSGLVLLLLSLALVGGLVTFWLRRGSVSDEMERMRQQQAEVQRLTEEAARQEENQASTGMGADVVDVAPESEATTAMPVAEPVAATPEVAPPVPATVQTQPAGSGTLAVKASGECWLEVTQGNRKLFAGILKSGDQHSFPLTEDLRVVYGAPQVVMVTVNGEDRGAPGNGVTRLIYKPDGTSTPFSKR